jgi:hypothetical protein
MSISVLTMMGQVGWLISEGRLLAGGLGHKGLEGAAGVGVC